MRYPFFALAVLILVCVCPGSVAQEIARESVAEVREGAGVQLSEAESREKAAVDRFWELVKRAPRRGTSLDRVYGYYVDTGQIEQLIEQCVALTDANPDDAKAWLLLGLVLSRRNDDEGAMAAFEKAESLDANDALSSYYLGEALIAQGRLRDAAGALERSVERKPQRADVLAVMQTLGRVYERFGDKEKAGDLWSRLEEMFPNDLDIIVRIAETLEEESKFDDALARYQKLAELAREKKDNYARVRFTLSAADIKIRLGNKQEAIADFDALLEELAGDNWLADSVRDRVERVFVRQADYAGLAGYYQKRLQSHPNDVETTRRLAVALVRLGRTDEAKTLLESTLERAPSNIVLRLGLIDLLVNDRQFARVGEEYSKIDELDPNNPDHISQWGLAMLENRAMPEPQRKSEAAKIWHKLVDARPNDQAMTVMVADLMAGAKINDEAEKLYLKAVELSPNDPSYREYLGFFYHRSEQKDKAVATLKQIAEGNRRTAANLSMLANIFKSLGYADESLETMQAAAEAAPRSFDVQLSYADMLLQNADYDEAKTQLATAEALVETDEELQAWSRVEIELLVINGELKAAIETLAEQLETATDSVPDNAKSNAKQLWRLAAYHRADGATFDAVETIEKALALDADSLMLLDTAADIYTKAYDEQRAADIYERLATVDAARRVDHLKKLANLQRDMGQIDLAIETARLVMATGSGNVANSRFYADMLIGIGRRADGIEALRRAVRIDPTDQVSLAALAEQLAQDGQLDEAIEINWRIFDRTEDLQGKIGQIGKLSNYYQQGSRFDQLIARLRQNTNEPGKRREAAYCLAQAHASVGDYFAARSALEMLLTNVDEEKSSDTFLLDQLSRVAEMQGDFASAIRYQEMLCDQTGQSQDRDRLLGLYYAAGERDKASNVYLQMVTGNAEFADQISVLDKLLAQEDYAVAQTLIERLELKYPDNWELMYRKMQALYWLRNANASNDVTTIATVPNDDAEVSAQENASANESANVEAKAAELAETYSQLTALARAIRKLENADDELSAVEQKARNAALQKRGGIQSQTGTTGQYVNRGSNYAPWGFGQHHGYDNQYYGGGSNVPQTLTTWNAQNKELVQTLFRERLQLEQHYYNRGSMTSSASPEKPLFKPQTFADAKFAALTWELKFAWDQDTAEFLENHPEEAELLKTLPEEEMMGMTGNIISPMAVSAHGVVVSGIMLPAVGMGTQVEPNASDDSEGDGESEEETDRERIQNALKFERLFAVIEAVEKEAPVDSDDVSALLERMRFEMFRLQMIGNIAIDDEIIMPLPWLTDINSNSISSIMYGNSSPDSPLTAMIVRLGLKGEKEWKQAAFRSVLQNAYMHGSPQMRILQTYDTDAEITKVVEDIEDEEQRADMARELKEQLEKLLGKQKELVANTRANDGFADDDARLDWLVETLLETAGDNPKQLTTRIHHYTGAFSNLPQIYMMLQTSGRTDDLARIDAMLDRLAEQEPQFYLLRVQISQHHDFDPGEFHRHLFQALVQIRHLLEKGESIDMERISVSPNLPKHLQAIIDKHRLQRSPDDEEEQSDEWKQWVVKMKDAIIKDIARHSQSQANQTQYIPSTIEALRQATMMGMSRNRPMLMEIFGSQQWYYAQSQNSYGFSTHSRNGQVYHSLTRYNHSVQLPGPYGPEEKRKLTADDLEIIARECDKLFDAADFHIEIMGEVKAAELAAEKQPVPTPTRTTPARPRTQSLTQYRYYFQGHNSVSGHEIRSLMQGQSSGVSMMSMGMGSVMMASSVQYTQPDSIFLQIFQQCVIMDTLLENSEPAEGVTVEQLQLNYVKRFEKYLDDKAESPQEGVAQMAKEFRDLLKNIDGEVEMVAVEDENDLDKMRAELEAEYEQAEENNTDMPANRLLALSLIYSSQKKFVRAMECLDRITFPSASDVKMREMIALQLYQQDGEEQEKLKSRAEQAIDKLLGYQLNSEELRTVRAGLQQFDRKEEADAIRDRLMLTATDASTMGNLLQELRNEDAKSERTVQFALKIFRSTAFSSGRVFQENSWERHIRDQAIDTLQQAGRLEEIVEQIEAQWHSSPGSFDIMTSLATVYLKADRKDDAEKLIEQMKSQIPDDAQKMMNFANVLRTFGQKEDAAEWMRKALAKQPAMFLQNYWEYQRFFTEIGQEKQLLEFLKSIDKRTLLQQSHEVANFMTELMRRDATKDDARKLFDEFWAAEDFSDNERMQFRQSLIAQMIWNPEAEFYPYFEETVLAAVSPSETPPPAPRRGTVVYTSVQSVNSTNSWSGDDARSISTSFVELAQNTDQLDELREKVDAIVAKHEEIEEAKRDRNRYCDARILKAMIAFKQDKAAEGLAIVEELREDKAASEFIGNQHYIGVTLAMAMEKSDDPRATELAIEFYEKTNTTQYLGSFVTGFLESRLVSLYIKSGDREKGLDKALASLRRDLRYLKICGGNSTGNVQIGNNYYSIYELSQSIQRTGKALRDAGCHVELLQVYRTQCEGQTWFTSLMNNGNLQYYTNQVKDVFASLYDNVSVEDVVANIEIFIPFEKAAEETPGETPDDSAAAEETAAFSPVPLFLGVSRSPVAGSGIATGYAVKLFDALRQIQADDAGTFAAVCNAVAKLQTEHPDDATVLLVAAWCKILTGEPADDVLAQLQLIAEWLDKQESDENVSDEVLMTAWVLAREIYTHPETYSPERFAETCEKMAVFAGRIVEANRHGDELLKTRKDKMALLVFEMNHFVPQKPGGFIDGLNENILISSLMQGGKLRSRYDHEFYDMIEIFTKVVRDGRADGAMKTFERFWQNGWPGLNGAGETNFGYPQASTVLRVFGQTMAAVEQSDADPDAVFDSLMQIVFPKDEEQQIFMGVFNDFGGWDGHSLTPAVALLQWAEKTGRMDEVLKTLQTKRASMPESFTFWQHQLDGFEYAVRLRTGEDGPELAALRAKLLKELKEHETDITALMVLMAWEGIPLTNDATDLEMLDRALPISLKGMRFVRYAYSVIWRNGISLIDAGHYQYAANWMSCYYDIMKECDNFGRADGRRHTIETRLLQEGLKAVDDDRFEDAVAILRYFAKENPENPRYHDLGDYLDRLGEKLDALPESRRNELLDGLDLSRIARKSKVQIDPEPGKPKAAESFDLPELPTGTLVYETDFETGVDDRWSHSRRDMTLKDRRNYLGEFTFEPVTFRLTELPEHKYLRIRFDLFVIEGWDGLAGVSEDYGIDTWQMTLDGDRRMVATTFAGFGRDPGSDRNHKQSYPDDYPPLFGFEHSWKDRVDRDDVWGDDIEPGIHYGCTGCAEKNDPHNGQWFTVYAVDVIVPHEKPELLLEFLADLKDGRYEMWLFNQAYGECWGLDNFRVETLDDRWSMTEEETALCFEYLILPDHGVKANAARWRLVAAGDRSVEYIRKWFAAEENAAKAAEFRKPHNFIGFRIDRGLQLINSDAAATLRAELFE